MIHFEEKHQNDRGIIVERLVEQNWPQLVGTVKPEHRKFLIQYIRAWYAFVEEYRRDTDPLKLPTTLDISNIRRERLSPRIEVRNPTEGFRWFEAVEAEKAMRKVDAWGMIHLREHYKQWEFEPVPPAIEGDLSPHTPANLCPIKNKEVLQQVYSEGRLLQIGFLYLAWESYGKVFRYRCFLLDGRVVIQSDWINCGALRRFKDPTKKHATAITHVQRMAQLTNWDLTTLENMSNKQHRMLMKHLEEDFKEGWITRT